MLCTVAVTGDKYIFGTFEDIGGHPTFKECAGTHSPYWYRELFYRYVMSLPPPTF